MTATTCNVIDSFKTEWPDDLSRGIWPRSWAVWYVAFWIALLLIRPWELLFPSLGAWHVERTYAIIGIIIVIASGQFRFCGSLQTTGVLAYVTALAISSAAAFDFLLAWERLYVYLTLVVFYFVLLSVVRTPYQLVFIVTAFITAMAVYLGKAEYEYFVHGGHNWGEGVSHMVGIESTYGQYNAVAGSTVLSLPFALFLWQVRWQFAAAWPAFWQKAFRRGIVLYFALALTGIMLTNSRSGMLCTVVFVVLSAVTTIRISTSRLMLSAVIAVGVLAVLWGIMPEDSRARLRTVWDPESGPKSAYTSAQGRVFGLQAGLQMFSRFPITGVGPGNFVFYRRNYLDGVPLVAHNTIGGVLGETGMIGGAAFVLMCAGVFVNCRATNRLAKRYWHPTADLLARLATACRNSIVLILFSGMFGDNQNRFHLLWAGAFCLLAQMNATDISQSIAGYCADGDEYPATPMG